MKDLNEYVKQIMDIRQGAPLPFAARKVKFYRSDLAKLMNDAEFKIGAEIGVRRGNYSQILCEAISNLKIYCVDPYVPYPGGRTTQERQDRIFEYAKRKLKNYNATFIRKTSVDAVKDFKDGSLDFVYIDARHDFDNCITDIIHWTPKVRVGGIVAGHDYFFHYSINVIPAVNAYTYAHGINEWYITDGDEGDSSVPSSWFWIKK